MDFLPVPLQRRILAYMLERRAPEVPGRSPDWVARAVAECFIVLVMFRGEGECWEARDIDSDTLYVCRYDGPAPVREAPPLKVTLAEMSQLRFHVEHWNRGVRFSYSSLEAWLLGVVTLREPLALLWRYGSQLQARYFSRPTKLRFDVLKALVEADYDHPLAEPLHHTARSAAALTYGESYGVRPDALRVLRLTQVVLDSLVEEGVLSSDGDGTYVLLPKSLSMLHDYEQERRRHEMTLHEYRKLNLLTGTLVFVGLLQVEQVRTWVSALLTGIARHLFGGA